MLFTMIIRAHEIIFKQTGHWFYIAHHLMRYKLCLSGFKIMSFKVLHPINTVSGQTTLMYNIKYC